MLCIESDSFTKLSLIQISELNNRLTVRNLNKATSQTSSLINHKCRQLAIATDVFLYRRCCGCWSTLSLVLINTHTHTHTHTLALFLSLRYLALFPLLSISHKNLSPIISIINWNTDFNILACSHFKGNIITKICFVGKLQS